MPQRVRDTLLRDAHERETTAEVGVGFGPEGTTLEDASIAAGIRDTSARRAAATFRRSACSIPLALLQPTTHLDAVAVGDATAKLVTRDASRVTRL